MKARSVLVIILILMNSSVFAAPMEIDEKTSLVKWHLLIKSNTNVYGEIKLSKSSLDLKGNSGELNFELAKTKSWELDDGEKDFSDGRDERIVKITQADEYKPKFVVKSITASENGSSYKVSGTLSLNNVKKDVVIDTVFNKAEKSLKAKYKLKWKKFDIDNPVIWLLRATSTPEDHISLDFVLKFK